MISEAVKGEVGGKDIKKRRSVKGTSRKIE